MEEEKRYPNSRSPSPWPSWLEDEALSGQWEGAVGGSDLSLPHTEEGTLVNVGGDWKYDMDQEPSPCGDAHTWKEHGTRQELYPLEAVREQEHPQWGARRIPGLYPGEEPVIVRELHQWEEDGVRYHEMIQWEDDGVTYKQLTEWEGGVRYRELIHLEVGVRYQEVTQWEVDGVLYQELTQCEEDGVVYHELASWEGNVTVVPSSEGTEGAAETARGLPSVAPAPLIPTDNEPGAAAPAGAAGEEEPLSAEKEPLTAEGEKAESSTAFQELVPPAGTESDAPAPHSPSEGKQALLDTDQQMPRVVLSQADLEIQGSGQQPEEEHGLDQSMAAEMEAAVTGEGEESPVPAPQSPCSPASPSAPQGDAQALSEQEEDEEAEGVSVLVVQETEERALAVEESDWENYLDQEISLREHEGDQELSQEEIKTHQVVFQGEACIGQELSPRQAETYPEPSSWEEYIKGQHFPGADSSCQMLSDWEDSSMEGGFHGKESTSPELSDEEDFRQAMECQRIVRLCPEVQSDWEDSMSQELSQDYSSPGHEFSDWEDYVVSVLSRWEDDTERGFSLEEWEYRSEHEVEVQHLRAEEDEWDDVSVLELPQEEGREEMLRIWEAEGLSVPAPREAWAERRAPEPCPAVPGCACPAQLAAQSPRGAAACAALEEQGAEAGTRSQSPAPQSPCCPPSPSPAPMVPSQKRPSLVRRALRALRSLFRSCLLGQPQD